jgi:hypothetical protein
MVKLADLLDEQDKILKAITEARRLSPGVRDRVEIKRLQAQYVVVRGAISSHHEDDRYTPKDSSDTSEKEYKIKKEEKRLAKLAKQAEKDNPSD